jgi:SAM-dependent methyltransferase
MVLMSFLRIRETEDIDLDSPETIALHRRIVLSKPFLRRLYLEYYEFFRQQTDLLKSLPGELLELGSGGGFLKEILPSVITSDIAPHPSIDRVISAEKLPFADRSLRAIFMLNVLHHMSEPALFFKEAERCLVSGGRVAMIEPFNSVVSRFVYTYLHHEPFDPHVREWRNSGQGRLSDSNQALPWIIFSRDLNLFRAQYPHLQVMGTRPHTCLRYILSGGLTWKSLVPGATYPLVRLLDKGLSRYPNIFPLFQTILLQRT